MADRKAELERKKKRLEEIRAAKVKAKAGSTSPNRTRKIGGDTYSTNDYTSTTSSDIDNLLKDLDLPSAPSVTSQGTSDSISIDSDSKAVSPLPARKPIKLSISHREPVNVPAKETVSYEKQTQTIRTEERKKSEEKPVEIKEENEKKEMPPPEDREKKKEEVSKMVDLSEDTKVQIMNSQGFGQFFDHAARIIEKAMCEEDCAFDYGAEVDEGESDTLASKKLALNRKFFDERWSKHRCITCMDWSQQHPELLVASYNQNEENPQDPDGIALVWNMKYHKHSPEYIFHHQSPIMSACFAQFHPNLLVGGSYSGQIVLWDNRSRKRTPVQKTPLSATAHTHPVYCIEVVGTQNAHNLISFSTDGRMCSWSLDMLSQPQEAMDLQHTPVSKPVSITCASFLPGDVNNFVVVKRQFLGC